MPLRSPTARIAVLLLSLLFAAPVRAAVFTDSAGRRVVLPDQIERVMPAGPASAVFVYTLVPRKLIGWPQPLSRAQQGLLPAAFARLPVIGQLGGAHPTATAADVARLHPDLIIGYGVLSPPTIALADRIQAQTKIPYILLDDSIQQMPDMLREMGPILGAGDHGLAVTSYAYHAIEALRGQLLISPATDRPRVYYGRGSDGLETGLSGSPPISDIDQAGVINVAAGLGRDGLTRVTRAQIFAWNPQIIVAQKRSFYNALLHDPAWRGLTAVRTKRVYLAPSRSVRLDRRPARGQSGNRALLVVESVLSRPLSGGSAHQCARILSVVLRGPDHRPAARGPDPSGGSQPGRDPPPGECAAVRRRAAASAQHYPGRPNAGASRRHARPQRTAWRR